MALMDNSEVVERTVVSAWVWVGVVAAALLESEREPNHRGIRRMVVLYNIIFNVSLICLLAVVDCLMEMERLVFRSCNPYLVAGIDCGQQMLHQRTRM